METIAHMAFYSGWHNATTAIVVAKELFSTPKSDGRKSAMLLWPGYKHPKSHFNWSAWRHFVSNRREERIWLRYLYSQIYSKSRGS